MNVESLTDFLDNAGVTVMTVAGAKFTLSEGTNLFSDYIPARLDIACMIRSGILKDEIDYELPDYHKSAQFQVIVRATEYEDGQALIALIVDVLTSSQVEASGKIYWPQIQIGNMLFNYIRPMHEPVNYPISENSLIEFSVNFDCNYVMMEP